MRNVIGILAMVALAGCYQSGADLASDAGVDVVDVLPEPDLDIYSEYSEDTVYDPGCAPQGCYAGSHADRCCPGLIPAEACDPDDPDCHSMPACILCGDGSCDYHETSYNCPEDCSGGCGPTSTETEYYMCEDYDMHSCTCDGQWDCWISWA